MNQPDHDDSQPGSFTQELGKQVGREARSALRWTARGAMLGAMVVGAFGLWYFSLMGLWIGAGIGAVGGGIGAFLFYADASTGF